ncbi:MAG: FAD-dependent oxidoreductase [Actinomycetota bacterium]|nr:FAD-dependent oxidoreductase [Actinomycetota bacterium]
MLGGGVAGLTAAHELAERGFDVVVLEQDDPRWSGQEPARAGFRRGRSARPSGRARLPLLPRLLPARPRHDEPHPAGRRQRARPLDGGDAGDDRSRRRTGRDDQHRAPTGFARRLERRQPVPVRVDDGARHPGR